MDFLIMTSVYFIIVSLLCLEVRRLSKHRISDLTIILRYTEACRLCHGIPVDLYDICCFARHLKSERMGAWQNAYDKDPLTIEFFPMYVLDMAKDDSQ